MKEIVIVKAFLSPFACALMRTIFDWHAKERERKGVPDEGKHMIATK